MRAFRAGLLLLLAPCLDAGGVRQHHRDPPGHEHGLAEQQRADRRLATEGARPEAPQCKSAAALALRRSMQQDVTQHQALPYLLTTQALGEEFSQQYCPAEKQKALRHHFSSRSAQPLKLMGALYQDLLLWQPCDLWQHIRGRTLWIGGDSHSQDLFRALRCVLHQFHDYDWAGPYQDLLDVPVHWVESRSPNLEVGPSDRPSLATCEPLVEGTRLCQFRANWGKTMVDHAVPWLAKLARPGDILVANFGAWHGKQSGVGEDYGQLVRKLAEQVKEQIPQIKLVWKDSSPTHFDNELGSYNDLPPPFECVPLKVSVQHDGTLKAYSEAEALLERGGALNAAAADALAGLGVPMMATFNATAELWEAHRGVPGKSYECNHYCFPGVPSVWVFYLFRALETLGLAS